MKELVEKIAAEYAEFANITLILMNTYIHSRPIHGLFTGHSRSVTAPKKPKKAGGKNHPCKICVKSFAVSQKSCNFAR